MKKIFLITICMLGFSCLIAQNSNSISSSQAIKPIVFILNDKTFGFDILVDEKLLIHQTTIPGIAGKHGFYSEEDANKVAKLMCEKISRGIMPPSITEEELLKLKIKTKL